MDRCSWFSGLGLLLRLLAAAALLQLAQGQTETTYFVVGGSLLLRPRSGTHEVTSAVWTHNQNLVVEWGPDLEFFGSFKDRTTLNMTTGEIRINDTTEADAGEFTVEINKVRQTPVYEATPIKKVPKPLVTVRTLACSPTSESCVLICQGEVTGAEPVTYFWRWHGGSWAEEEYNNLKTISKSHQGQKSISCRMKNPVSEEESELFQNPMYTPPQHITGPVVGSIFAILSLVGVGVGVWKREDIKTLCCRKEHAAVPRGEHGQ